MRATNVCLNSGRSSDFAANHDPNNALDVAEKGLKNLTKLLLILGCKVERFLNRTK